MKIGLISDTHGYLDPQIPALFKNVDHILHGGDVGYMSILLELEGIAPVTAVLGNVDDPGSNLREFESISLGNLPFLLHHIVDPHQPSELLARKLEVARPRIVVFGHTHKPFDQELKGVRFLNPGYAGKQRFNLPRTVALLQLEDGECSVEWIPLDSSA